VLDKGSTYPRIPGIWGQPTVRDRGNGLKAQPLVYRWTSRAGWVIPTSYEVMRMKAVNHKPMNRPKGTLALQGGEEVSPHQGVTPSWCFFSVRGCFVFNVQGLGL